MNSRSSDLVTSDTVIAILTFVVWFTVTREVAASFVGDPIGVTFLKLLSFTFLVIFSSFLIDVYNTDSHADFKEHALRMVLASLISLVLLSFLYYMMPFLMLEKDEVLKLIGFFVCLQIIWHKLYFSFIKNHALSRRVLILGTGAMAGKIAKAISSDRSALTLAGHIKVSEEMPHVPPEAIIGNGDQLAEIVKNERIRELVVALSERRGKLPLSDILNCKFCGLKVVDAPTFYEEVTGKLLIEDIRPSWFFFDCDFNISAVKKVLKRMFDIAVSLIVFAVCLPLIPIIALLIKIDSKGPVFFRQVRVGEMGKHFIIYKFRTMIQDAETGTGAVWAGKNDLRITRVGKFLRKTRFDEIPQLFNIFRGDMSAIGPRPERPEFIEGLSRIIPFYSERHFVKPGLTGWAQVCYPYGASIEDAIEKLRYDLYYIKHLSLFLDIIIYFKTIKVILFGWGAR